MDTQLQSLAQAIMAGKRKDAKKLTEALLAEGVSPHTVMDALSVGMDDVGRRFKANEIYLPEVLVSARAMQTSMNLIEPHLVDSSAEKRHTVIIGTVQGDLHDIGKNLVAMMLKGAGFNVVDLGTNVTAAAFLEAAETHNGDLIGLSALLTTTMPAMKETVEAIKAASAETKVMIGGAPITQDFANEIGADGFSPDAASAVDLARSLVTA